MNSPHILFFTLIFFATARGADAGSLSPSIPTTENSSGSLALPAPRPPATLTLSDVLIRVAESNPELLAQSMGRQAADGRVEQAGMGPNPTLSLSVENFGGSERARGSDIMEVTVQANQLIERGDKSEHRIALAEREREIAQASLTLRKSEILAASANAFAKVLMERERLALTEAQLKLAQETLASANRRLQVSLASASEVARARVALASAQAEKLRAQASATVAVSTLALAWGGSAAEVSELIGELRLPEVPPSLARFEGPLALSGNPRLALLSSVVAGQRASLEIESARSVADVTVGAGLRRLNEGPATAFVIGASIPLTFRDDNSGNIRAAQAMIRAAEQSLRAAEAEQRAALAATHAELVAAHAQATALRRDALPAAEEASALVQVAYEKGAQPLADVLDARRSLVSLRRELLDAELAYVTALVRAETIANTAFSEVRTLFERP